MQTAIAHAKITLPGRRSELLSRQRLINMLDEFLDYRLIAIIAPAGYGKTSTLVDFAHQTHVPTCWYTIDSLDNDPQRFIAHLIAAIQHRFPNFGKQSSVTLQNINNFSLENIDLIVTVITNEIHASIPEDFLLIVDDYHLVNDHSLIQEFMNRLLVLANEKFHVAISSRKIIDLDFVLFVSRNQARGLGMQHLAFTVDELQQMAFHAYHLTLSKTDAEKLMQKTEGWPAGLALSIQAQWAGMTSNLSLPTGLGPGVELHSYLARQVFEQQNAEIKNFLLKTSLLEEFDAELCQQVFGPGDWAMLMAKAMRDNLFLLAVDSRNKPTLRYHHLFQDFLQRRIAVEQPQERTHILTRLADVYVKAEAWEKAHNIYFNYLQDIDATVQLLTSIGPIMLDAGRLTILAGWLDALPHHRLHASPALLSLRGYLAVTLNEVEYGLDLLNQAVATFRASNNLPQLTRALVRRAVAHRFLANYQDALDDAEETLKLTEADENLVDVEAEALRIKGAVLYNLGQLGEAIHWLEQSMVIYDSINGSENIAALSVELGMAYESAGSYTLAEQVYNEALKYWQHKDNWPRQANLLNNLGVIYHLKGQYQQALLTFEETLKCARLSGYVRMEAFALASIGDLYVELAALEQALVAYCSAQPNADRYFLAIYLDLTKAAVARLQTNFEQAHSLMAEAKQRIKQSNSTYEYGLYQLEAGRLAFAENKLSEAITNLKNAQKNFIDGGYYVEAIKASLCLASAHYKKEDVSTAIEYLQQTFNQASNLDSRHPLIIAARYNRDLLEAIPAQSPISNQVSTLLGEVTQFEQNIPKLRRQIRQQTSAIPFAPPKLRIQTLGKTQIILDEKIVPNNAWKALVARDLFLFILNNSKGVTKETIGLNFWPDYNSSQLDMQFKKTMYRLRQTLGRDVVLFDTATNRYCFNHNSDYDYDVETFYTEIRRAESATSSEEQILAYETALNLYQGAFLADVDNSEWAWFERERLAQAYTKTNLQLMNLYLECGKYYEVLERCEQTLADDPFNEGVYRRAMRAYAALGNKAGVIHQFKRCQEILLQEVGAPVSLQTEVLYQTIV